MKTQIQKHVQMIAVIAITVFTLNVALADDLNPPTYRGGPLSVYAHWQLLPGTNLLDLTAWNSVDDTDPTTTLYPNFTPNIQIQPNGTQYQFQVPNWIDTQPIKYLRLQLTWEGTLQPPMSIFSQGLDGVNPVFGQVVFTSPIVPDNSGVGSYQYFDIEYKPNPDFERFDILLPPDGLLTQVVVDSISTVPEPATLALLAVGSLLLRKRK